jgi:orotidine-5'-phosphate decarboxylase
VHRGLPDSAGVVDGTPLQSVMTRRIGAPFGDRLIAVVRSKGNAVCLGLDPRPDLLPPYLWQRARSVFGDSRAAVAKAFVDFNCALIDGLADIVPVCKPQIAFYEEYGAEGIRAFADTVRYAHARGLLVISDAKRGDIGPTAAAYARAHLDPAGFDADAMTVNPYMGADTVEPYLELCARLGKGIFLLVKTSNPGSGDVQDLDTGGRPLFERVAEMVARLGAAHVGDSGFSSVGAVVGATYPEQARRLRAMLPDTIFLVPGYGAQGATASGTAAGFRADGLGAVVNSARDLIFAFRREPYASRHGATGFVDAARAAAVKMAEELTEALSKRTALDG